MVLYYDFNKYYDNGTDSQQLITSNLHLTISKKIVIKQQHTPFLSVIRHSHVFKYWKLGSTNYEL